MAALAARLQGAKLAIRRSSGESSRCLAVLAVRSTAARAAVPLARGTPALRLRGGAAASVVPAFQEHHALVRCFAAGVQKCPDLGGESIKDGAVMEWRFKVGDHVRKDDLICVIETDKVSVDVKAEFDGVIKEIHAKADDTIEVGKPLCSFEAGAAGSVAASSAPASEAAKTAAAAAPAAGAPGKIIEQKCADFGAESITEGTLMEWRKNVGEYVAQGEIITVIETDKVSVEVKAEEAGTIKEIFKKADDTVEVGQLLLKIETGGAPSAAASAPAAAAAAAAPAAAAAAAVATHGAPLTGLRAAFARTAAQRLGLPDPTAAAGTPKAATSASAPAPNVPAAMSVGDGRTEQRVPLSRIRRRVMDRLKETQKTAALLSTFQEADMSAVETLQKKYNDVFLKKHGTQFGYLSMYAKATAQALLEEPGVNAVIDDSTTEVVYRDYVDLSVPIPSPRGPVSCVLRNVESMSVLDIQHEITSLAAKARTDTLAVEDLSPCTFGITDTTSAGGMLGTGIINPPQSAVMGVNAVTKRPVAVNGKVEARPVMYMSLTYDHRLIDGREAVTFLASVRDKLEDPSRMLIGL